MSGPGMTGPPLRSLDLRGRTILLSGGAGALGTAISATLAAHGARVVAVDVLPPAEAAERMGAAAWRAVAYRRCDCADDAAVRELFDHLDREGSRPDTVCAHAGIAASAPVERFPSDEFDDALRVNVRAAFVLAREAAGRWRDAGRPGHLIFTGSWVQDVPWPQITPYAASKAALRSLARGFARELAPYAIRANVVAPGIVGAGMAKHQWDTDPEYRARAAKAIPLGTLQSPQSVADAFLFLCSDLASYMTGATLLVDGGASLYPLD
jgi:NAD(P)-dependent dehydrogenase (short-subunit alcohol dehydrogenase family)